MYNHLVIDVLKSFTKKDVKRFREFLNSPYHNKSEKLIKFYDALIKFYPTFNSASFTIENIQKKISPSSSFNNSTMLNQMSFLLKASQNYLVQNRITKKEIELTDFLRAELFERKLNNLLQMNIRRTNEKLEKEKIINAEYFLNKIKLSTDALNFININKPRSNRVYINDNINKLTERGMYITYLFVTEILKEFDNLRTLENSFDIDEKNFIFQLFEKINFSEILKFLASNSGNKVLLKIFETYYYFFNAFSNFDDERNYLIYKKYLLENQAFLSTDEIRFHFGRLVRYCMQKSLNEVAFHKYESELFNVYNFILTNGYYKSEVSNYLPVELYRTVLLLALKLRKFKWTMEFIKKFKSKVHPDRRRNMYYYSLAHYYFNRRMYEDTIKSFHKVDLNHFLFKVDMKNLMLMTYYELNEFEPALSLIDSYKQFLSHDKILTSNRKKQYREFVNTLHKMILYKTSAISINKKLIEKKLVQMPFRDWLSRKLLEIDNK